MYTHTDLSVKINPSLTHTQTTHTCTHTYTSHWASITLSHKRTSTHTLSALCGLREAIQRKNIVGVVSLPTAVCFPLVQPDRINKCQSLMLRWSVAVGNPGFENGTGSSPVSREVIME